MTIRQNILLGRDVTEEDLRRAISVSRLESDISSFGDGVDTMVGERGVTLSGGQQQRLAIARALVGHPSLLLLDDPTSALDAETEAAFWASLEKSESKPTTVVVTHRISTIERSDAVVVMEKGEVVKYGSFGDLQKESAVFTRIYKRCLL
jgi:ABC-type multidrug transport system fused ATPase/permease subunit